MRWILFLGWILGSYASLRNANESSVHSQVENMYRGILPCLQNNPIVESQYRRLVLKYPKDAEQHYKELLQVTAKYRKYSHHEFGGYRGPWIESLFIEHFIDKPLSYFNGFIPIFVQWIENDLNTRSVHNTLFDELHAVLRPDVLYLLVSQANRGIYQLADAFPNILMLSAGGFGHIPIPLIKGELPLRLPPAFFPIDIGFYGDEKHGGRAEIFEELAKHSAGFIVRKGKSSHWIEDMERTKFNLAPAGYGPTSFRLAEILQLGRVPVHISSDRDWIPYEHSPIAVNRLGFVGSLKGMAALVQELRESSDEEIRVKLRAVAAARWYYTYEGLLRQIALFIENPYEGPGYVHSGSYLRCQRVPLLHTWHFWWESVKKKYIRGAHNL